MPHFPEFMFISGWREKKEASRVELNKRAYDLFFILFSRLRCKAHEIEMWVCMFMKFRALRLFLCSKRVIYARAEMRVAKLRELINQIEI